MKKEFLGFKIWYSDHVASGKTYEDWTNLPNDDIQVVVLYWTDADGDMPLRHFATGTDYYALNDKMEFMQGDITDGMDGNIKTGKWTTDAKIDELVQEATNAVAWEPVHGS